MANWKLFKESGSIPSTIAEFGQRAEAPAGQKMKEEQVDQIKNDGGEVCAVCSDKATGIHYRVQSCEGCKGFWRRTIQRNKGNRYTCKLWTENCPVTPETRGRCQRCRYLACVKAGMVADLVMADKERLSRLRLVDQNREKRRQENGISTGEEMVEHDGKLLEMVHTIYGQYLLPTINQDMSTVARAAYSFVECLLFQLMGQRDMRDFIMSAHMEVACIHLITTRPPMELMSIPLISDLAAQSAALCLVPSEVVLSMAMAATRPRLTWPVASRHELTMLWDLIGGTVRRSCSNIRMAAMLQLVHQVQALSFYINPMTLMNSFNQAIQPAAPPPLPNLFSYPSVPHTQQPQQMPHLPPPQWQPPQLLAPPVLLPQAPQYQARHQPHFNPPQEPTDHQKTSSSNNLDESLPPDLSKDKYDETSSFLLNTPEVKKERFPDPQNFSYFSPPPEDQYLAPVQGRPLDKGMPFLEPEGRDPEMPYLEPEERIVGAKYPRSPETISPSSIPPKKRKFNLYSEIFQEAIHSTLD